MSDDDPQAADWLDLCRRVGAGDEPRARALLDELRELHAAPPRHYHTFDHALNCVRTLHESGEPDPDGAVEFALWFHDAAYDTRRQDNEENSAEAAARACRDLALPDLFAAEVARLILATKHAAPQADPAARLVCDVDLKEGLVGSPGLASERVCALIREEFAWVPAPLYAASRIRFLSGMLERPTIFQLEGFRRRFEAAARENIRAEIGRLQNP